MSEFNKLDALEKEIERAWKIDHVYELWKSFDDAIDRNHLRKAKRILSEIADSESCEWMKTDASLYIMEAKEEKRWRH